MYMKTLSAKYYQENKERLKKKARDENLSIEEKKNKNATLWL